MQARDPLLKKLIEDIRRPMDTTNKEGIKKLISTIVTLQPDRKKEIEDYKELNIEHPYGELSLDAYDAHRYNALGYAFFLGHTDIACELLRAGAYPNTVIYCNKRPFEYAFERKSPESVCQLIMCPAIDLNMKGSTGTTFLMEAILAFQHSFPQQREIIRLILNKLKEDKNINLNIQDHEGKTALICAAWVGDNETVNDLLNTDVDITTKCTHKGTTALMVASAQGHHGIVRSLLDHPSAHAQLELTNFKGQTALDRAIEKEQVVTVSQLLERGAQIKDQTVLLAFLKNCAQTDPKVLLCYHSWIAQYNFHQLTLLPEVKQLYQTSKTLIKDENELILSELYKTIRSFPLTVLGIVAEYANPFQRTTADSKPDEVVAPSAITEDGRKIYADPDGRITITGQETRRRNLRGGGFYLYSGPDSSSSSSGVREEESVDGEYTIRIGF